MNLPNWLKIAWWLLLIIGLMFALWSRKVALMAGEGTVIELTGLIILAALLLAPLFNEISLFGFSLKQEVKDLKNEVTSQVAGIKTEIRNAVDVQTTFNPQFNILPPPSDAQLPGIEKMVKDAVSSVLTQETIDPSKTTGAKDTFDLDADVQFLFSTRYHIERELRYLAERHRMAERRPLFHILQQLGKDEVLPKDLERAIAEVLRVSTPAIHGEKVTPAQIEFTKDVAPGLILALQQLNR